MDFQRIALNSLRALAAAHDGDVDAVRRFAENLHNNPEARRYLEQNIILECVRRLNEEERRNAGFTSYCVRERNTERSR